MKIIYNLEEAPEIFGDLKVNQLLALKEFIKESRKAAGNITRYTAENAYKTADKSGAYSAINTVCHAAINYTKGFFLDVFITGKKHLVSPEDKAIFQKSLAWITSEDSPWAAGLANVYVLKDGDDIIGTILPDSEKEFKGGHVYSNFLIAARQFTEWPAQWPAYVNWLKTQDMMTAFYLTYGRNNFHSCFGTLKVSPAYFKKTPEATVSRMNSYCNYIWGLANVKACKDVSEMLVEINALKQQLKVVEEVAVQPLLKPKRVYKPRAKIG